MEKKDALKIIFLGNSNVGKSCIIRRYANGEFSQSIMATVSTGLYETNQTFGDANLTLQLWDTAGQERFSGLSKLFYRNSHLCVLVFDKCDSNSLHDLKKWKNMFLEIVKPIIVPHEEGKKQGNKDLAEKSTEELLPPFILVGNKVDLKVSKRIRKKDIDDWIDGEHIPYFEVSALKATGIDDLFENICKFAMDYKRKLNSISPKESAKIVLTEAPVEIESKSCCS